MKAADPKNDCPGNKVVKSPPGGGADPVLWSRASTPDDSVRSHLCGGACDRSCDPPIGSRSSPNRNGNRAWKVRGGSKKVICDRAGRSEPGGSSKACRWVVRKG